MTKKQALALVRQKFGRSGWVEDRGGSSSPEARAWAREEQARNPKPVPPDIRDRDAWPDSMTLGEFRAAVQQQQKEYKAWKPANDRLWSQANRYRYRVGALTSRYGFAHVLGEGDSWEEAVRNAGIPTPEEASK